MKQTWRMAALPEIYRPVFDPSVPVPDGVQVFGAVSDPVWAGFVAIVIGGMFGGLGALGALGLLVEIAREPSAWPVYAVFEAIMAVLMWIGWKHGIRPAMLIMQARAALRSGRVVCGVFLTPDALLYRPDPAEVTVIPRSEVGEPAIVSFTGSTGGFSVLRFDLAEGGNFDITRLDTDESLHSLRRAIEAWRVPAEPSQALSALE